MKGTSSNAANVTDNGDSMKSGDWKRSDQTAREILEVATFAADNLIEFAKKENNTNDSSLVGGAANNVVGASFDIFGKWYNSGGFQLVPWLELLDLSKWDYSTGDNKNTSSTAVAATSTTTDAAGAVTPAYASGSGGAKRARINNQYEPLTPGLANMSEPIGSPTTLFESGAMLGATPAKADANNTNGSGILSFANMFGNGSMGNSRTVVSFDFSGSSPPQYNNTNNALGGGGPGSSLAASSFHIDITEENLIMLRNLVRRTGLSSLTPQHVESLLMKYVRIERNSKYTGETLYIITRKEYGKFIRDLISKDVTRQFDANEMDNFSNYFTNFFTCFDAYSWNMPELNKDEVNAKELLVGFTFLFAGNKSSKLAAAYDIMDVDRAGYLTQRGLMQYLRSYLTMLAGISLMSSNKTTNEQIRKRLLSTSATNNIRDDAFLAVENGAKWTLSHFLKAFEKEVQSQQQQVRTSTRSNAITFEDFAKWYTEGGYAVAPWLELLDLQKFLSLIGIEASTEKFPPSSNDQSLSEVLFTFPLANNRSLVVLRDDAHYVRSVVSELGLLSLTCEDIWSVLFNDIAKSTAEGGAVAAKSGTKKSIRMEVDQMTFVNCMMRILNGTGKMKHNSSWIDFSPEETLKNFYLSFDLAETKLVPLNQLMCGLTLLCGGKKSNKLIFAYSLFGADDSGLKATSSRKKAYLTENDFFFFFRSFLIVMFSCCNQSLSLSADAVTQFISDTAKSVANDVMAYWKAKRVEKVKFENFSEWYNEGGFEMAPWLELLDLNKWVLADELQSSSSQQEQQQPQTIHQPIPPTPAAAKSNPTMPADSGSGMTPGHESMKALLATPRLKPTNSPDCPPAPPDDDPLFDLDMSAVDGEVDDMDFILQESPPAHDGHAESIHYDDPAPGGLAPVAATATTTAAAPSPPPPANAGAAEDQQNALKFNLLTSDQFGGYMVSIGPSQVQLLRRIVIETGLYRIDAAIICRLIIYDSKSRRHGSLTKKGFETALKRVFDHTFKTLLAPASSSTQQELAVFTDKLYNLLVSPTPPNKVNSVALACAFAVLCGGRKSDKLELMFELLDENKDTLVSREEIGKFIKSFLIILMSVSSSFTHLYGGACSNDDAAIAAAIDSGSEWATSQVFDALKPEKGMVCFDDFADWYTKGGYQSMPWLELLDLKKWVITS